MKRTPHTPDEKAKLVLEVLQGEHTLNEIASANNIHPTMLARWKKEAIEGMPSIFQNDAPKKRKEQKEHQAELEALYAQIGKLTTQNEWLKKKSGL
jgi:transposase-like protein